MKSLTDLLKNHPIPGIREAEIRRTCAEVVKKAVGVVVEPKHIKMSDGVLSLAVPPLLKSALILKFSEVQEGLLKEGITLTEIR